MDGRIGLIIWVFAGILWGPAGAQSTLMEADQLQRKAEWFLRKGLPVSEYAYTDPEINMHLAEAVRRHRQQANRKIWSWISLAGGAVISGTAILSCETGTDGSGCDIGGRGIPFFLGVTTSAGFRIMAGVAGVQRDMALEEAHSLLIR